MVTFLRRESATPPDAAHPAANPMAVRGSHAGRWLSEAEVEPAGDNLSPTWSAILEEELDGTSIVQTGWAWANRAAAAPVNAWRFSDGSVVLRDGFRWQATDTFIRTADGLHWVWSRGTR